MTTETKPKESTYTKEDILQSKYQDYNKDVISIVLEDNKEYNIKEIDRLYNQFMKKEIKEDK